MHQETERRRNAAFLSLQQDLTLHGGFSPQSRAEGLQEILRGVQEAYQPWFVDRRTEEVVKKDEAEQAEDFYFRTIELYKKQRAVIEEIENVQ